jgi:tRNA(Ser,Leu) C12 N-acetylase TAN1
MTGGWAVQDWNVVVSVHDGHYRRACAVLGSLGEVAQTDYYNVLVMRVDDREDFLRRLAALVTGAPDFLEVVSRVMPASEVLTFQSATEFEARAKETVLTWLPCLAGRSFHVRMHRRGFKEQMSSHTEERFLDDALLHALGQAGTPGRIDFTDPDLIIDVETVGQRAGLSLWARDDLLRYPFLKVD